MNKNSLNLDSWLDFLGTVVTQEFGSYFVNGILMETGLRTYHRWTRERTVPNFFRADKWLCRYDLFIQDFVIFCETNNLPVWAGDEPDWAKDTIEETRNEPVM